ncbi:MAG: aspartate aminotransferase family protein [Myxococcota bacterium]
MKLPQQGMKREDIVNALEGYRKNDLPWKTGRTFGYVYDPGHVAMEIGKEVYASFLTENALDPTAFPSLARIENEVVGMARRQARGDDAVVGTFTSGGTESIILAVKAAREWAKANRPNIKQPELVLPATAHAAFHKAAYYLGVKTVVTRVDPHTFRADVDAMRDAINENTVMLVGSTPGYAHGVVDPVPEIAALAHKHGILCHVDACVGGWLLPYFRRLGGDFPEYDFTVDGVTSMSMDLHKYAFTPKGASVVLYRNADLRLHQIYACNEWTGYSVVNAAVQSSKSGGPMAAAWATMCAIGDDGYLEIARQMKSCSEGIVAGIGKIPGLRVLGRPDFSMVAFTSADTNVFHVIDEMHQRGWYVQPQFRRQGSPENIHLSIGPTNLKWVDAFLKDLTDAVRAARELPVSDLATQMEQVFRELEPSQVSDETIAQMMGMAGATSDGDLPGRMAEVNQILNVMPPSVVERALRAFVNGMFKG